MGSTAEKSSVAVLFTAVTIFFGVGTWTIKDLHDAIDTNSHRMANLEEQMLPLLVDYKVKKELEKMGYGTNPSLSVPAPCAAPAPPVSEHKHPVIEKLTEAAHDWAASQIRRGQQKPANPSDPTSSQLVPAAPAPL